ncbi:MAG: hypothetical protein ACUVXD_06450 [Thermodesulfobacteriota bacterium]
MSRGIPRRTSWWMIVTGWLWALLWWGQVALAHTIHYAVEQKGITIRVFYAENDPANYAEYELFGPGDTDPYQVGRTDRRGCLSLLPDRPGEWKVKVLGESAHGFHGITIDFKVDQAFGLVGFSKPLVATHTRLVTGLSLIIGLFGIYAYWRSRKRPGGRAGTPRESDPS